MNNLSIQLILNQKCQLVAVDNTRYNNIRSADGIELDDIRNYVSLEFLVYTDNEHPSDKTVVFKEYKHKREEYNNITTINFPSDGTYTYYKFLIPKLDRLVVDVPDNISIFRIKNQIFWYKGNFYLGFRDVDDDGSDIITPNRVMKITNLLDIWKCIKDGKATQTFSYQRVVFSICKLQSCLVNLQKKMLTGPKICLECNQDKSLTFRRNFLLSALYVLDYLKDKGEYYEAQRILDNLSSCNSLCGDDDNNLNNDCGCGSIKY